MFQKFVFHLILAAFGFILVPTNYWHSCEKTHDEHSESQASIDTQHSSCSICDFDLFQLDTPEFLTFKTRRGPLASFPSGGVSPCHTAAHDYFNKGPPSAEV
ncbi:MAG: hypothetical protein ACO1O6_06685 [Bacteroidota bacterium]